jgi:hypothetical protein
MQFIAKLDEIDPDTIIFFIAQMSDDLSSAAE